MDHVQTQVLFNLASQSAQGTVPNLCSMLSVSHNIFTMEMVQWPCKTLTWLIITWINCKCGLFITTMYLTRYFKSLNGFSNFPIQPFAFDSGIQNTWT